MLANFFISIFGLIFCTVLVLDILDYKPAKKISERLYIYLIEYKRQIIPCISIVLFVLCIIANNTFGVIFYPIYAIVWYYVMGKPSKK